jgi:inhibitor of KinA sporulation pathway (predicted exonuclease)
VNDPRLEALAAIEHEQWIHWAQQILIGYGIPRKTADRWRKVFVPYAELSEESKDVDRAWATRVLAVMAEHGVGFKFEIDQEVAIRDEKIKVRIVSRIEEATQRLYRVAFWNQGQRQYEVVSERELDPC